MPRQTFIQNDDNKPLAQDWHDEFEISKPYYAYRDELMNMLAEFQLMSGGHLGRIIVATHFIDLLDGNTQSSYSEPHRARPKTREFEKIEIEEILKDNTVEPAQTELDASIVFAPKKNGFYRFSVDHRRLNAVNNQDLYLMSRSGGCISSLSMVPIFLTLDASSGYWRLEIDKTNCDKTALTTQHGSFLFLQMRFALRNAPGPFQPTMDVFLLSMQW